MCLVFAATIEIDDRLENIMRWNGFVQVRIEFVPNKPIMSGIHVTVMLGNKHFVKLYYERLGEFCYNCGKITHPNRRCNWPLRQNNNVEQESIYSFGPWLRAKERMNRFGMRRASTDAIEPEPDNVQTKETIEVDLGQEQGDIIHNLNFETTTKPSSEGIPSVGESSGLDAKKRKMGSILGTQRVASKSAWSTDVLITMARVGVLSPLRRQLTHQRHDPLLTISSSSLTHSLNTFFPFLFSRPSLPPSTVPSPSPSPPHPIPLSPLCSFLCTPTSSSVLSSLNPWSRCPLVEPPPTTVPSPISLSLKSSFSPMLISLHSHLLLRSLLFESIESLSVDRATGINSHHRSPSLSNSRLPFMPSPPTLPSHRDCDSPRG
ncbi:hypothetical protein Tsubulata_003330 [Turnera subulata]|uniref:Zinc knuckle CX2CX4HX4C domain-containing protein n=1 Tax=Turnera subulata TaxID=218843 RepID=A0A9Q0JN35_9ROSI|nr:hypothetical protein Tsubulata_003330 [Turnera subulata]